MVERDVLINKKIEIQWSNVFSMNKQYSCQHFSSTTLSWSTNPSMHFNCPGSIFT